MMAIAASAIALIVVGAVASAAAFYGDDAMVLSDLATLAVSTDAAPATLPDTGYRTTLWVVIGGLALTVAGALVIGARRHPA